MNCKREQEQMYLENPKKWRKTTMEQGLNVTTPRKTIFDEY